MDLQEAKARICDEVDRRADTLIAASHEIHDHPEENFAEHHAHDLLSGLLEGEGLAVERHACGHNIIAAAGLGAGLAAAALADELGGQVRILGTPAEEGGGGKVFMVDAGALDGVDAAMMVHPADADLRWMTTIAIQRLEVVYRGHEAHAAASPWMGRNALDAAVLGYMNVAALRQHIRPHERVHGIFTDGGDKPNIVPARAAMNWYVRAADLEALEPLKERVLAALTAGAAATNSATLGRTVHVPDDGNDVVGSTDMGNVSYVVPSIHPMIAVAPKGISIHTPEFALHAAGPAGDAAVLDGAKAMAMTVVDLWLAPDSLAAARAAFEATG